MGTTNQTKESPVKAGTNQTKKPTDSVLEKVGKAAIKRHGFKEVYVTSDGQVFPSHSDASNHAVDLTNKEILKVAGK